MHKGSDYQIFDLINLSRQQNKLKQSEEGSVMIFMI